MRVAVVATFLNESAYLERFLASLARQTRPPDRLLLVDDGSDDDSARIAQAFSERHEYARTLLRPRRPRQRDRLVEAPELDAFLWAVGQVEPGWDVVAKLDADLELTPRTFEEVLRRLGDDPRLGIAGAYLAVERDGGLVRERCPPHHVRGAVKFYRRACFEQIQPLPRALGWDTLDEVKARMHGWRTASFPVPGGDPVHLRPVGAYDGSLRWYRRAGMATRGYGAHPLWVVGSGLRRIAGPPPVLGAAAFFAGYLTAGRRGVPRPEPDVRAFSRRETLGRIRRLLTAGDLR